MAADWPSGRTGAPDVGGTKGLGPFKATRDVDNVRGRVRYSEYSYVAPRLDAMIASLVAVAAPTQAATVVDLGCADRPYEQLFGHCRYVGVDLPGNELADVVLEPSGAVPLPDGSAEVVLSTQVLEHVDDPVAYLAEARRLLAPGGRLVLTTHGIMVFHPDPNDYWRWTGEGLRHLLERAGFTVEELRGVMGLEASGLQLLQTGLIRRGPAGTRRLIAIVFQALIALVDRFSSEADRQREALVHGVVATKR